MLLDEVFYLIDVHMLSSECVVLIYRGIYYRTLCSF